MAVMRAAAFLVDGFTPAELRRLLAARSQEAPRARGVANQRADGVPAGWPGDRQVGYSDAVHYQSGLIGDHRWSVEGDVLRIAYHGAVECAHMEPLIRLFERALQEHGYLLVLIDLREAGGMHPGARRMLVESKKDSARSSIAFFGASVVQRVFMGLIGNAARLLQREALTTHIAASEAEALAWLERERRRYISP